MAGLNGKEDLRVARTNIQLNEALISLLTEKSFEEISVTDICECAMVHRTTFYKHFKDKYHLLEFSLKELDRRFEGESVNFTSTESMMDYYMDLIREFLQYMKEHKKLYVSGLMRTGNQSITSIFHRSIRNIIETKLLKDEKAGFHHKIPTAAIAEFYAGAVISSAIWWLENETLLTIDEMVYSLSLLINENKYVVIE